MADALIEKKKPKPISRKTEIGKGDGDGLIENCEKYKLKKPMPNEQVWEDEGLLKNAAKTNRKYSDEYYTEEAMMFQLKEKLNENDHQNIHIYDRFLKSDQRPCLPQTHTNCHYAKCPNSASISKSEYYQQDTGMHQNQHQLQHQNQQQLQHQHQKHQQLQHQNQQQLQHQHQKHQQHQKHHKHQNQQQQQPHQNHQQQHHHQHQHQHQQHLHQQSKQSNQYQQQIQHHHQHSPPSLHAKQRPSQQNQQQQSQRNQQPKQIDDQQEEAFFKGNQHDDDRNPVPHNSSIHIMKTKYNKCDSGVEKPVQTRKTLKNETPMTLEKNPSLPLIEDLDNFPKTGQTSSKLSLPLTYDCPKSPPVLDGSLRNQNSPTLVTQTSFPSLPSLPSSSLDSSIPNPKSNLPGYNRYSKNFKFDKIQLKEANDEYSEEEYSASSVDNNISDELLMGSKSSTSGSMISHHSLCSKRKDEEQLKLQRSKCNILTSIDEGVKNNSNSSKGMDLQQDGQKELTSTSIANNSYEIITNLVKQRRTYHAERIIQEAERIREIDQLPNMFKK